MLVFGIASRQPFQSVGPPLLHISSQLSVFLFSAQVLLSPLDKALGQPVGARRDRYSPPPPYLSQVQCTFLPPMLSEIGLVFVEGFRFFPLEPGKNFTDKFIEDLETHLEFFFRLFPCTDSASSFPCNRASHVPLFIPPCRRLRSLGYRCFLLPLPFPRRLVRCLVYGSVCCLERIVFAYRPNGTRLNFSISSQFPPLLVGASAYVIPCPSLFLAFLLLFPPLRLEVFLPRRSMTLPLLFFPPISPLIFPLSQTF